MSQNAGNIMAHVLESHFGPCSELVNVADFLKELKGFPSHPGVAATSDHVRKEWNELDSEVKDAVASECNVFDLKSTVDDAWRNRRLAAHILKSHSNAIANIHGSADVSGKQKRKRVQSGDPVQEDPEVLSFQEKLDNIRLKSWPLNLTAALFVRSPRSSDQNALQEVKQMSSGALSTLAPATCEALITLSIYNPITWSHGSLARASQHVVLASQTLGNLFDIIPCPSREIPEENVNGDHIVGYHNEVKQNNEGCVICIEQVAYGDGRSEIDYAKKLMTQLEQLPVDKRPIITRSATSMYETTWASLSLRINEPYWLLHQGNCEHYVVIDEIRSQHPSDPPSGYPLTIQITPPLLNLCRACNKVPAVWSIVGDMRLGESPCVLCEPCWQYMGSPLSGDGEVLAVPLPRHELGCNYCGNN